VRGAAATSTRRLRNATGDGPRTPGPVVFYEYSLADDPNVAFEYLQ
jgi:hypothetical protein